MKEKLYTLQKKPVLHYLTNLGANNGVGDGLTDQDGFGNGLADEREIGPFTLDPEDLSENLSLPADYQTRRGDLTDGADPNESSLTDEDDLTNGNGLTDGADPNEGGLTDRPSLPGDGLTDGNDLEHRSLREVSIIKKQRGLIAYIRNMRRRRQERNYIGKYDI